VRPLTFTLKVKPPCLVDAAGLRPQALAGQGREALLRIMLPGWNQSFAVGDLFSVSGEDSGRVVLEEADGSLIRVGAGLEGGELTVAGHAGDYAGEAMRRKPARARRQAPTSARKCAQGPSRSQRRWCVRRLRPRRAMKA
jgi:formylmethanofuran dehydrogenase subunit C